MVVVIIGLVMLGFGMITAVSAVKPPHMPPDYYWYPGYPDAAYIFLSADDNVIYKSEASFVMAGWVYYVDPAEPVDERELFPQPIRIQIWFKISGGDWCEIKLSRYAVGNAAAVYGDPHYVGPIFRWYAYFEPGYFDVGVYQTHIQYTCKDPNNPTERMVCWNTEPGSNYHDPLDWYGVLTVLDG